MKVGILYICTGSYIEFFEEFYTSSEKNFLLDCEKHYFVFTEGYLPIFDNNTQITIIKQHQLDWPFAVLYKFHYFLQVQHLLHDIDYLVMTNANMIFLESINKDEILPSKEENYLFGTEGPWLYKTGKFKLIEENYENNTESKAYIDKNMRKTYYAAGFCGGRRKEFLEMSSHISSWVEEDLSNGIYPKWDDQAYLNKYFLERNIKKLTPSYCYPEEFFVPFEKKIVVVYKQERKNDPLKKKYRKYTWDNKKIPPKNFLEKIRKNLIYYLIKYLRKFE